MMLIFVFLGLLVSAEAKGIPVFVQTGKDLLLDIKEAGTLENTDLLTWTFNGSKAIARFDNLSGGIIFFGDHESRAKLFSHNQSLQLRSLTKSDSGDYRAQVYSDNLKVIADYKVTVLDPVSPVKLTVKTCSSDSSNLTVSCSTQDSLISKTFTCDDQNCSEERGEREESTTPAASLKVHLRNNSIICVHSNRINRTEDIKNIEQIKEFCNNLTNRKPRNTVVTQIVVPIFLFIVIILAAAFLYLRKKRKSDKRECIENTVYEVPEIANKGELLEQRPTDGAPPINPTSMYSCLGDLRVTGASPVPKRETLPETVYASVRKAEKSQDNSAANL